jgi:hypothetical protein
MIVYVPEDNFCATGCMIVCWGQRKSDQCPSCEAADETMLQIFSCANPQHGYLLLQAVDNLQQWFEESDTATDITGYWLACHFDGPLNWGSPIAGDLLGFLAVGAKQDSMGWCALMNGRLLDKWLAVQQHYLDWMGRHTTGCWWLVALVVKLRTVAWDQWEVHNEHLHRQDAGDFEADTCRLVVQ